ncbi:hypothetical protein [Paragemmobacter ruber]|uniref:Uncharacterized protein n=1 Tax=Paragemmobacter ruber TaxID=1985673 RepID=A0ABW9Y3P5_9RHOB|nr:hypothetical protein [Rhodobacter ruber]NBE06559.1 hypothetical protein [Rhodobacter ruber]
MKASFRLIAGAFLAAALILPTPPLFAQERMPPRKASPMTVMQVHSGHSLTDAYNTNPWPGRLILATEKIRGTRPHDTIFNSTIPGSPLHWRWNNRNEYGVDARHDIGRFELLVTTEGVPFTTDDETFRNDTLAYLDRWVAHAWKEGNQGRGAELMLYSTWNTWKYAGPIPDYDPEGDVPFRERLNRDGARWEEMQDSANANRPEGMPPIYMIPGHRLMMRIYDDIEAGKAPHGLTSIGDIFADEIHLNDKGQYAITMLVYAVIYQRNPRELPDRLAVPEDTLSAAQARYFKTIAWEVATTYDRTGVPPG